MKKRITKKLNKRIDQSPTLKRMVDIGRHIVDKISNENLSFLAAGVSFYCLLSIFPAMTALVSVYGLIADVTDIEKLMAYARDFFPVEAYNIISDQLNSLVDQSETSLSIAVIIGLLVTFFSAARGVRAMLAALNMIYDVKENRNWLRRNALTYVLTIGVIITMAVTMFAIVVIPILIKFLHMPDIIANQLEHMRWLILGGALWIALAVLFRYGPNREPKRWFSMLIGAAVATCLWILISGGFALFVELFPSFNDVYGSLSAVVVLMFWFFLSSYAILTGAAVNVALEKYYDI